MIPCALCIVPFSSSRHLPSLAALLSTCTPLPPPAPASESTHLSELVDWFLSHGGSLDGVSPQHVPRQGTGLVATCSVSAGETLAVVPPNLMLRLDRGSSSPQALALAEVVPEPLWPARLAVALLVERAKGEASHFAPYVASLPDRFATPIFWSPSAVASLQYAPIRAQIKRRSRWLLSLGNECLGEKLVNSASDPFGGVCVDAAGFAWAWSACSSRAFRLGGRGDEPHRGGWGRVSDSLADPADAAAGHGSLGFSARGGGALTSVSDPTGGGCGAKGGVGGRIGRAATRGGAPGTGGEGLTPPHGGFIPLNPYAPTIDAGTLLPVLDLANHDESNPAARAVADGPRGPVRLVAARDLAPGDQVTISYGPLSNDALLLDYGFVVEHNPHDSLELRFDPGLIWLAQRAAGRRPPTTQVDPAFPWHLYRLADVGVRPGATVRIGGDPGIGAKGEGEGPGSEPGSEGRALANGDANGGAHADKHTGFNHNGAGHAAPPPQPTDGAQTLPTPCPYPEEFLAAVRILVAAAPADLGSGDAREPVSRDNEEHAMASLTGLCSLVLRHLPGSPADDLRDLTEPLPEDERLAVLFRLEKKRVLIRAMEWAARRLHQLGGK